MQTRTVGLDSRAGAILGMVLVIMLAISIVGVSLIHMASVNGLEMSRMLNGDQAFWSAEAGLQQARALLKGNAGIRSGFFPYQFSGQDYGYGGSIASADNVNFQIVSTGIWQNAMRIVRQDIRVELGLPEAFDYAIYSGNTAELRKGTTITGDIFADNGYRFVGGEPSVSGGIYDDAAGGSYPAPVPVPPPPLLDTAPYDRLITNALSGATTAPTYPLNLGGSTNYLHLAAFTLGGRVNGPGALVISGDISIPSGSGVVGDDVTLISGGMFTINKDCTSGSNAVFYAATGFDLAMNNNISIGSCLMITPGDINIAKELNFTGLMYAGGTIDSDKTGTLVGSMIAVGSIRLKMEYHVTYDASVLPSPLFPGFEPVVRIFDLTWSEVFP